MTRIRIIQFRKRPEMISGEQEEYARRFEDSGTELDFISALDEALPWDSPARLIEDFDGIILGGSGEFDFDGGRTADDGVLETSRELLVQLRPLVAYLFEQNIPLLGICYGHQLMALARGGTVMNDTGQNKVGTHTIRLTEEGERDALFAGLPDEFAAQYGHKDSVTALPPGAIVLAQGDRCEASALRYSDHIYSVQFHPELTAADVERKLRMSPGYLPESGEAAAISESPVASSLLPRFVERIVRS